MKMHIHYDKEGDYLEVRFGKPTPSYYQEISNDVFERKDEKTGKTIGYAFYNVEKRKKNHIKDIEVALPTTFAF